MTTNPLIDPPSWPLAEFCPPPEFIKHWESRYKEVGHKPDAVLQRVAEQASQWGADKELDACCEWVKDTLESYWARSSLRAARRPKPPSLKEQALLQLDTLNADLAMHGRGCDLSQIRRALEQLNG